MNNYTITTEITADLSINLVNELGITVIPMIYSIDGIEHVYDLNGSDTSLSDFYKKLENGGIAKTTQINPAGYIEYFEPILASGNDLLHIGFSSGLSGSFNSAVLASELLKEKYPNRRCICIDSLSASSGHGLLVYEACQMKKKGLSITELQRWVEENKLRVAHWFIVSDLDHLQRGGRISATAALVGSVLHVYPILKVNDYGKLEMSTKIRGSKKAVSRLNQILMNNISKSDSQTIMIAHSDDFASAQILQKMIASSLPEHSIFINDMGPIIGAHTGKNALTLHFFTSHR